MMPANVPRRVFSSMIRGVAGAGLAFCVSAGMWLVGCRDANNGGSGQKTLTIAVIPKGATHEHWKRVHIGADKAAAEFTAAGVPVRVVWNSPLREDDREQQVQLVEGFISQGINGLVLAPLDSRALLRPVEEAARAGIPTVIFDSALATPNPAVSYVATDNERGGRLAADRLGGVLHGKGTVLLLRYQEGSAATEEREHGFLDQLKTTFPGITLISSDQYAGATRDTAKRASENLLNRYAADRLDGIFTPNESSTAGMLLALQDIGRAGKIAFVGFDYSSGFIEPLRRGELQGFVVQNPVNMGYLSVKTMVSHLLGKPVEKSVDTGVLMVTPDNLDTAAVQAVLNPPEVTATQSMLAAQQKPPPFVSRGEPGPEHHRLDALAGEWRTEGKWMIAGGTPEKPVRTDNLRTVRTWVADGRFLRDVTEGTLGGKTYWRMGLLGFSTMDRRYEWVTVDALNTMQMIYQGEPGNDALNMTGVFTDQGLLGEATVGKQVGQRTQIIIESPDRHIIRLYMKPPNRPEFLASEMVFTRVH